MEIEKLLELYNSYKRNEITLEELENITGMKSNAIRKRFNRNGYKCKNGEYILPNVEKENTRQVIKRKTDPIIKTNKKIMLENTYDDVVQVSYKYYSGVIERYNILCNHYRYYKRQDILSYLLSKAIDEYWTEEMQEELEKMGK